MVSFSLVSATFSREGPAVLALSPVHRSFVADLRRADSRSRELSRQGPIRLIR
jgi:hypothetical protein